MTPLPLELLLAVLTRMTIQTVCRMRQTTKFLDDFIEKHRSVVDVQFDVPRSLWIAVDAANNCVSVVVMNRFLYHFDGSFIYNPIIQNFPTMDDCCVNITDPVKQLSAIRFQTVYIECISWLVSTKSNALEVLQSLKLDVEWLALYNVPYENLNGFFSSVRFRKVIVCHDTLSFKRIDFKQIEHCEHLVLRNINETVIDISHLVRPLKEVYLRLYGHQVDLLTEFLTRVAISRSERGNLRRMTFHIDGFADSINIPDLSVFGYGYVFGYNFLDRRRVLELIYFYKMVIDGGFAFIVHKPQRLMAGMDMDNKYEYHEEFLELDFIIYFVENDDRGTLFDVVFPNLFHNVPYDLSATYDQFMTAETEVGAFKKLYYSYATGKERSTRFLRNGGR